MFERLLGVGAEQCREAVAALAEGLVERLALRRGKRASRRHPAVAAIRAREESAQLPLDEGVVGRVGPVGRLGQHIEDGPGSEGVAAKSGVLRASGSPCSCAMPVAVITRIDPSERRRTSGRALQASSSPRRKERRSFAAAACRRSPSDRA